MNKRDAITEIINLMYKYKIMTKDILKKCEDDLR